MFILRQCDKYLKNEQSAFLMSDQLLAVSGGPIVIIPCKSVMKNVVFKKKLIKILKIITLVLTANYIERKCSMEREKVHQDKTL